MAMEGNFFTENKCILTVGKKPEQQTNKINWVSQDCLIPSWESVSHCLEE